MVTKNEIIDAASQLPPADQAAIADALLGQLMDRDLGDEHSLAEVQDAWGDEIKSRLDDIRSGRVKAIPADEAHRMMFSGDRPEV